MGALLRLCKLQAREWRQTLNPGGIDRGQRIAHFSACDEPVGRNFGERTKHESTLKQARMRQGQAQLVNRKVAIGDDVDVGGAWAPALLVRAVATKLQFDDLRPRQQIARAERGLDRDAQVDERRLILE